MDKPKVYMGMIVDGIEIIGEAISVMQNTITMKNPCLLASIFSPTVITDLTWYSKDSKMLFNRDVITCEYVPSDKIIEIYEEFLKIPAYEKMKERINDILDIHLGRLKEGFEEKIEGAAEMKMPETFNDIIRQMSKQRKNKMN